MAPVLHVQRFRHGHLQEATTLPPGAPLVSGETILIARRWGRYRLLIEDPRPLRTGARCAFRHGRDRYLVEVRRRERGFRPALIEPDDVAYLGSLSSFGVTILTGAVVAWLSPPLPEFEMLDMPTRCQFGFIIEAPEQLQPPPCGAAMPEDVAGLDTVAAFKRLSDIHEQGTITCGVDLIDLDTALNTGRGGYGMVELLGGDPHRFAELSADLHRCQDRLTGDLTLSFEEGTFTTTANADPLTACLNRLNYVGDNTDLTLRFTLLAP